jgi:hypothetical protein
MLVSYILFVKRNETQSKLKINLKIVTRKTGYALTFNLFLLIGNSLFEITRLSRGFRYTKKQAPCERKVLAFFGELF